MQERRERVEVRLVHARVGGRDSDVVKNIVVARVSAGVGELGERGL